MQLDRFKHEFKRLNGVYATDKVVLFRNPLELYSLTTGKIIASFNSLDEALHFEIDGKTLEQRISAWTEITFPVEHGGRGGVFWWRQRQGRNHRRPSRTHECQNRLQPCL